MMDETATVVPPLVAENHPGIEARFVKIDRGGDGLRAYFAAPVLAGDALPSIVLAMHLSGVDTEQRATARRFAKAGFATLIPDLYARFDAPDSDAVTDASAFLPFAKQLGPETVDPDIRAAATWLRSRYQTGKIAIAGFCMGGRMAMRRTSGHADTFAAAAFWYGFSPDVDPSRVDIPFVASYGADDVHIPVADIEAFTRHAPVVSDVKIYPHAGHAFFDYRGAAYDPVAAADSWDRTIVFLSEHLKT